VPRASATPPEKFASFGELLRFLRLRAGFTQRELSIAVGYSESQISRFEKGYRPPEAAHLAARFVPALGLEAEPEWANRLLELAATSHSLAEPDGPEAAAASLLPNNLPVQLTSFIGREKELAEIRELITPRPGPAEAGLGVRLLTLTGPGGTGKTRLALQAAAGLLPLFPDGVWWVELAQLADPGLIAQAVAVVLGVKEAADRPLLATLAHHLRGKRVLLILDNCEHLIAGCAQFADALLRACPRLCLLASSREMLGVAGERAVVVPSLSLPEPQSALSVETLGQYEAVRLFVERGRAVLADFALTAENAPAVVQVCQRLDGIPLALELAAARLRMLPVEQIAARLNDSFQLLTGGPRTALPRQQTLQASISWSYELLTPPEQTVLRRLAVFSGGWSLEAAEAVCAGPGVAASEVVDLLARLIDKSLAISEAWGGEARYRLLETIRQYAMTKLAESGEAAAVRRQHAEYFLALAEAGGPSWLARAPETWLNRMQIEHDNLRAALAWSQVSPAGAELGMRLANQLSVFWYYYDWSEERGWLERALAHPQAANYPGQQARSTLHLGMIRATEGDLAGAQTLFARSLDLLRQVDDRENTGWALERLGWLARERGEAAAARAYLEESAEIFREIGEETLSVGLNNTLGATMILQGELAAAQQLLEENLARGRQLDESEAIGWTLNHLGQIAQLQGEYEQARRLHEASLQQFEVIGRQDYSVMEAHQSLGETALAQGDAVRAAKHFGEGLLIACDLSIRVGMAWCLAGLAGAAALDEEPERAARLWGAAEALRLSIGVREAPASHATRERLMADVREQLGEAAFAAAWAEGQAATLEEAIDDALEH
jgi:predicted ATPase/transcriptional regulator with XRE-family HTH domain